MRTEEEDAAAIDKAIFTNPVSVDEDPLSELSEEDGDALASTSVIAAQDDSEAAVGRATTARTLSESRAAPAAMGTHIALAKMQRLSKENRDQNKDLVTKNDELTEEVDRLATENKKIQSQLIKVQQQVGLDVATPLAADIPKSTQELQLQQWADNEKLSTETREVAKQTMDSIVNVELMKQKASVPEPTEAELRAINELEKAVSAVDLTKKKDTVLKHEFEAIRIRDAGAFGRAIDARAKLRKWLGEQRLMNFEHAIVDVGGRDLSVEDLRYCREEDIDQMAGDMSFLEKRRFVEGIEMLKRARVAVQAQEDDGE